MGFRFRRSVRLMPGVRLNFSKSGVSTSVGGHGATINFSKRGTRTTVGLPGTGLSYSTMSQGGHLGGAAKTRPGTALGGILIVFLGLLLVGFCASRNSSPSAVGTPAATTAAPATTTAYVVPRNANCRSGPSETAPVLRHLSRGTAVTAGAAQDGWKEVSAPAAADCWVAARLLAGTAAVSEPASSRGLLSTGAGAVGGIAATAAAVASHHALHQNRHEATVDPISSGCSCSTSNICIGPRGGRYCITSGGSKRYGV